MKKLKLNFFDFEETEVLTREELKHIFGGSGAGGGESCSSNSDCGSGHKCVGLSGFPKQCVSVSTGSSCQSDNECGNGQSCVSKPYPATGRWCV